MVAHSPQGITAYPSLGGGPALHLGLHQAVGLGEGRRGGVLHIGDDGPEDVLHQEPPYVVSVTDLEEWIQVDVGVIVITADV